MRSAAVLLPFLVLAAACSGPARQSPVAIPLQQIRIAVPAQAPLAQKLRQAVPGDRAVVWVGDGGEADMAVTWGSDSPPAGMEPERLPSWDRSWYLEVDTLARWVNDPTFRRWLSARIDRAGMARVLFGEDAEPIPPDVGEPGSRPVSIGATPRIQIVFDPGDLVAARIASRLRADLLSDRVMVEPAQPSPDRASALHLRDQDPNHTGDEPHTVIPLVRQHAYLWLRPGVDAGWLR